MQTRSMQKQIFCQLRYILMMTLRTVSMVDISITNEKPGSILRGTENERLSLECTFDGKNHGETLFWKRNGKLLTNGGNGYAMYSFIPKKKDHLSEFSCELYGTLKGKIKEKVITLDIKYKPVLNFNFTEESLFIKGETKTLCCSSDSNPSTDTMWLKNGKVSEEVHYKSNVCLTLMNISDTDSGIYSCFAGNEIGHVEQEININVLYPPVFVEEHKIIQFRYFGEHTAEKVVAHSVSSITWCHIEEENGRKIPHDMECIPENTTPFVHDSNNIIPELEIAISFTAMQKSDFQKYKITLCNHDGNSSCIMELKLRETEIELPRALDLNVILLSSLTTILLVTVIVFALVKRLKNKRIQTTDDVIEVVENSTDDVENVLYQSNACIYTEATNRSTLSKSAAVSNSPRSNPTNEENQSPQRLNSRVQESTRQLNYADIIFKPALTISETRIIGIENKTEYADVDFTNGQTGVLNTQHELNSDDEDFVEIEDLEIFSNRNNEIDID